MKKIHLNIFVSLLVVLLGFTSCFQESFTELNYNEFQTTDTVYSSANVDKIDFKSEVTEKKYKSAIDQLNRYQTLGQLITAQFSMRGGKKGDMPGPHAYQYQFSLEIDNYSGYLCLPQNFDGRMKSTYYDSQAFNGGAMGSFMQVKNAVAPVLNHPKIDSIPEIKAVALLIYDYAAQEVIDIYGAFPYQEFKENKQKNPFEYNSTEYVYNVIVQNIDTIVACFDNFNNRPDWYKQKITGLLTQYDKISSNKSIENWRLLANSLKLRMAMHIVKIDPTKAKKWAEEAIHSGVIEQVNQEFKLSPLELGFSHPLADISNLWNDTRLNASMESILASYNHPMLDLVFDKNSDDIINDEDNTKFLAKKTKVVGLRSGIRMLKGQSYDVNFRTAYSKVNKQAIAQSPLYVMKLSEVLFLRSEGALRGWNMGGTAQNFYEEGVKNAFKGVNMKKYNDDYTKRFVLEKIYEEFLTDYLAMETPKAYTYQDPYNTLNDSESLTKIGVKWNDGDDNETKLEKIITQKYIAGFPYSFEAWTDIRRTGYPKIFPVLHDDGDGSIPQGDIIRRIPFTDSDPAVKEDIQKTGLKALGGPDLQGTRLWWDINKPNF